MHFPNSRPMRVGLGIFYFILLLPLWVLVPTASARVGEHQPPPPASTIDEFIILDRSDKYQVTIIYPGLGNSIVDAELSLWARGRAASFTKSVEGIGEPVLVPYELHIYYETIKASEETISVVFTTTITMGAAYPESGLTTFAFDLGDGRRLSFGDLFRNLDGLVDLLSRHTRAELRDRLGDRADLQLLESGTAPDIANFDLFSISPTGLILHFPPGQAAPVSEGYRRVSVGLDALTPLGPYLRLWGKSENS